MIEPKSTNEVVYDEKATQKMQLKWKKKQLFSSINYLKKKNKGKFKTKFNRPVYYIIIYYIFDNLN
jgi:hypothetical protein